MAFPTSQLSGENVLRDIHDPATQTIRTSATAVIAPGLEIDISHTDDSIRLGDGISLITSTNVSGKQGLDINVINNVPVSILAGSSVQITDGFDALAINTDGSINVSLDAFTADPDSVQLVGSIDGLATGTKYGFINNLRQQILAAHDREEDYTYADFGTKNERITRIEYTSVTFPGYTVRRDFTYTLVGSSYRLDNIDWTIV